jgi:hypothetical protein
MSNQEQIFLDILSDGVKRKLGDFEIDLQTGDTYWFVLRSNENGKTLEIEGDYVCGYKNYKSVAFVTLDEGIRWLRKK